MFPTECPYAFVSPRGIIYKSYLKINKLCKWTLVDKTVRDTVFFLKESSAL